MSLNVNANLAKAEAAWGLPLPGYIKLLADACDRTNQRAVADRLGMSGGYVSRVLNQRYAGSYEEAEKLIRATFGDERVNCPAFGQMSLKTCIRNRRRKHGSQNFMHLRFDATCPTCPNNTDRPHDEED